MVNSSGCIVQYLHPFSWRVGGEATVEAANRTSQGTERRKRQLSRSPQRNIGKTSRFTNKEVSNKQPCREEDWRVELPKEHEEDSQNSFLTTLAPMNPSPCFLSGDQYATLRGPPTPYGVTFVPSPTRWQYTRSPSPSDLVIDEEVDPRVGAATEVEDCVTVRVPRGAQRPSSQSFPAPALPVDAQPHRPRCQTFTCSNASWLLSWPPPPPPPPPLGPAAASSTPPPPPPSPPRWQQDEETHSAYESQTPQSLPWPSPPPAHMFAMATYGWDNGPWVVRGPRTPSIPPPPPFSVTPYSEATLTASPAVFETPDSGDNEDDEDDEEENLPKGLKIGEGALLKGAKEYRVHKVLGAGVYGTVLRCEERSSGQSRAIKVVRLSGNWGIAARNEARALGELSINKPDENSLLRLYESFVLDNFLLLVTEHLQTDLHTFLLNREGNPLRMDSIAFIVKQLLNALQMLERLDIIHTDIKPDNVMLINHYVHPFRVKLIDFSNAVPASGDAKRRPKYAQSRWYRAPEVVLGHQYGHAVDMWSLGCLAAELACARPLFPARGELQLLRAMCAILGPVPARMLFRDPRKVIEFFCVTQESYTGFRLKTDEEYQADGGRKVTLPKWQFFDCFEAVFLMHINLISADEKEEFTVETAMFQDLLVDILSFDQGQRITPSKAMEHPFIDTIHLRSN